MTFINLLSVFVHILAATIWLGGMFFMLLVIVPAFRNNPDRVALFSAVGRKFRNVGWTVLFVLLVTGIYNLHSRGIPLNMEMTQSFMGFMGFKKLIIFLLIILVSYLHDFVFGRKAVELYHSAGETPAVKKFRIFSRIMAGINLLLAITAVGIGVVMVRGWIA